MRILYVAVDTPIPGTHGGSIHAWELCRALAQRGHQVHLLAPAGSAGHVAVAGPRNEETARDGVRIHRLARPARFLEWTAVTEVRSLAQAVAPDVIVERFYTFGGAGIRAAHALQVPAVLEVNSPARPFPGSWRDRLDRMSLLRPVERWRRRLLRWSDGVYTTSRHLVPVELQSRVTVVTNGVDVERFTPGGPSPEGGPLRCAFVSSFRSWHGAEDLVDAVKVCASRGIELDVTCLGRGPRWAAARAAAERAGLDRVIRFAGEVANEQVPAHLACADVGLAPFSPDAFSALQLGWFWSPIKIFEYLAAGLAVVTIDIPQLRELLPDTVARFYPAGQPTKLAEQLEHLSADRAGLSETRRLARDLAVERYTWAHQASVVEGLLRDVVGRRRSGDSSCDAPRG